MALLNATYLWGLLALLVPLAIHLLNRGNVRKIKVGSIKFLPNTETKQARNIRLNELLLLFLRSFILLLLVFILTNPKVKSQVKSTSLVYLVEPSLLTEGALSALLEELPPETEVCLLNVGFENLSNLEEHTTTIPPNYWQLVGDIKDLAADSIVVISKGLISGLKGARPATTANINWIVLDNETAISKKIKAHIVQDSIEILSINSSADYTRFNRKFLTKNETGIAIENDSLILSSKENEAIPLQVLDTIAIGIQYQKAFANEAIYFEKAFQVVSDYTGIPMNIDVMADGQNDQDKEHKILVWLSLEAPPKVKNSLISYRPNRLEQDLIVDGATKGAYELTRGINIDEVLNSNLMDKLLILVNFNTKNEDLLTIYDQRVMPKDEAMPNKISMDSSGKTTAKATFTELSIWLWLTLVIVIIVERLVSKYRKQ